MHLTPAAWLLAAFCALAIGLSKTGLSGFGIFGIALMTLILPARQSSGYVLPLLICADVVAVTTFRRHAVWKHILRMFAPAAGGIVLGFLALQLPLLKNGDHVKELIGGILTAMILFTYYRRATQERGRAEAARETSGTDVPAPAPHSWLAVIGIGLLAGFLTGVANASGPLMALYLLAIGLPKMEFIGTGAYFFLIMNCFKIPFSAASGFITVPSLWFDLAVAPFAVAGAFWGKWLIGFVNQKLFENLALAFALLSGIWITISPFILRH